MEGTDTVVFAMQRVEGEQVGVQEATLPVEVDVPPPIWVAVYALGDEPHDVADLDVDALLEREAAGEESASRVSC